MHRSRTRSTGESLKICAHVFLVTASQPSVKTTRALSMLPSPSILFDWPTDFSTTATTMVLSDWSSQSHWSSRFYTTSMTKSTISAATE